LIKYDATGLYYSGYTLTPYSKFNKIIEDIAFCLEQKFKVSKYFGDRMDFLCLNV